LTPAEALGVESFPHPKVLKITQIRIKVLVRRELLLICTDALMRLKTFT
jgi:hypothetical protein